MQEAAEIFDRAKDYVRRYTSTLVDFTCSEITEMKKRRVTETRPFPDTSIIVASTSKWEHKSSVQRQITYYRGRQYSSDHKGSGQITRSSSWSDGEFANTLKITFENLDNSQTTWDHWELYDGKKEAVFSYSLDAAHSQLAVSTEAYRSGAWQRADVYVPYKGFFYAATADGTISRLIVNTPTLPPEYAMERAYSVLDYGPVDISGKTFLLVTRSSSYIHTRQYDSLFLKRFTDYRHFEADSKFIVNSK